MKVIVDNKIPYIHEAIEALADEVVYAPGNGFTPKLVQDADALIIRTRTVCDRQLLEGSNVQFIATATIGYDHIDTDYCREAGIVWTNAPGSNANSVAEYIESCLTLFSKDRDLQLDKMTIGIVGAGHVGSRVARNAAMFGMKVLENDPPRAVREEAVRFCSLDEIAEKCDIISFHTPLIMEGEYKTFHLADGDFFRSLRRKPVIINTSRGEVVSTKDIVWAMNEGIVSDAIIDVWENEPDIDLKLLDKAYIATPHIAGYSGDGKGNATRMALEALCRHFNIEPNFNIKVPELRIMPEILLEGYNNIALIAYNPMTDTKKLKENPVDFEDFRNNYPLRRETKYYAEAWGLHLHPQA